MYFLISAAFRMRTWNVAGSLVRYCTCFIRISCINQSVTFCTTGPYVQTDTISSIPFPHHYPTTTSHSNIWRIYDSVHNFHCSIIWFAVDSMFTNVMLIQKFYSWQCASNVNAVNKKWTITSDSFEQSMKDKINGIIDPEGTRLGQSVRHNKCGTYWYWTRYIQIEQVWQLELSLHMNNNS